MKRVALAALLLMALQVIPVSAGALPTDTDPLGTLKLLPAGTDQATSVTTGAQRLVVEFAPDMEARGAFGVKFSGVFVTATGPRVPSMVDYSDNIDDVGSASAETPASQVFAGLYGDVEQGATCPANTKPRLWAYSVTRTEITSPSPYVMQGCEQSNGTTSTTDANGVKTYTTSVTKWTPGFWLDFTGLPSSDAPIATLFQYEAVYGTGPADGDFYEPGNSDAGGTGTLLVTPGA